MFSCTHAQFKAILSKSEGTGRTSGKVEEDGPRTKRTLDHTLFSMHTQTSHSHATIIGHGVECHLWSPNIHTETVI